MAKFLQLCRFCRTSILFFALAFCGACHADEVPNMRVFECADKLAAFLQVAGFSQFADPKFYKEGIADTKIDELIEELKTSKNEQEIKARESLKNLRKEWEYIHSNINSQNQNKEAWADEKMNAFLRIKPKKTDPAQVFAALCSAFARFFESQHYTKEFILKHSSDPKRIFDFVAEIPGQK